MPDLLLELFSEEIPARMQAKAADDLRRMVTDKLVAEGLVYEGARAFATPRRLALTVHGIPARQSDLKEERKGPRVGGPEAAIAGFLKATGLASLDEAKIQRDPKKGDFYIALIEKPGRATLDVLADMLPVIIRTFPWPKSMRWGERSGRPGALQWVRPLHSIIATFGIDTEDPDVVKFAIDGIEAGQTTYGHRFMAPAPIKVRRFEDYEAKLLDAKVVLDAERRKDIILAEAKTLAQAQNLELVEDQGLLDEVAGLVEWPVVLMGSFEEEFLSIPHEVIRATIRTNLKCFVVSDPKTGKLTNKFIPTANIEASDGGKAIVGGNERVIRARLSDAKFFYETDLKNWKEKSVDDLLKKFENIVFHDKLGAESDHIKRVERLAVQIAPLVGADVEKTRRAAQLAKADLLSEVVGEFPELRGMIGKHYALVEGEDASVAIAIEEHYRPQGPTDIEPKNPISMAVALADKIDTLVGFWTVDEKPSGRGDQYGLRRAALGVIRLILSSNIRATVADLVRWSILTYILYGLRPDRGYRDLARSYIPPDEDGPSKLWWEAPYMKLINYDGFFDSKSNSDGAGMAQIGFPGLSPDDDEEEMAAGQASYDELYSRLDKLDSIVTISGFVEHDAVGIKDDRGIVGWFEERSDYRLTYGQTAEPIYLDLLTFFVERLKGQLREQGARHDLVDAVFALGGQDDLLMVVRRVEALGKFLDTDDGKNLLAGTKRAANILRIEEKKDGKSFDGMPDTALYNLDEEKTLAKAIDQVKAEAGAAVAKEDFAAAMTAMAKLRPAVDAFFDKVKVNDDDPRVRENRLKLLNEIRAATRAVADFSRIQD